MTTASSYFTPGPNGEPPMFGVGLSGTQIGFASDFTPVVFTAYGASQSHAEGDLALCEKAAMGWIRSKGCDIELLQAGGIRLWFDVETHYTKAISGQPDWLGAARWVYEQTKGTKNA